MRRILIASCLFMAFGLIESAVADEMEIAKPELLLREAVEGMPGGKLQEVRVLTATIKPGSKTPFHTHRFPVTVYILEGAFTLEMEGKEPVTIKAGEAMVEPPNTKMIGYNRASDPMKVVIFYVSDPETPFLDPTARTFKRSNDPAFAKKVEDVVGLYMHPPAHSIVLSIDEKSQIQALDRTQPGLPLKPGKCGTMTHDYKRHGTTTLFAALNVLDGTVLGRCMQKHTHQEFIRFLNAVERATPPGKIIHAIADNYATHKHPKVRAWLARHPRWVFHFTPTSASWLNAVENFFSVLSRRRLKRGVFTSIVDLQAAINRYIDEHNDDPQPFVWTKPANTILAKLNQLPVPSE